MKVATRTLAVVFAVIGHMCIFAAGTSSSPGLIAAYLVSVAGLWSAAWMLWSRTMD